MRSPVVAVVVVLSSIVGCASSGSTPAGLDTEEGQNTFQGEFVVAHNDVRVHASPEPSPALTPLVRNLDAQNLAQDWANGCVFEHRPNNALGENIAVFSPRPEGQEVTPDEVVQLWASEAADFDYGTNSCAAGAQCGHYTQLVWRDTTSVGCAVAECSDIPGFGPGSLYVCNYDPPGNFVGEQPY